MIEWFKVISLNNMIYIPRLLHFLGHWLRQLGQDVQLPLSHSLTSPCVMGLACFCAVWSNWHQSSMPRYWWIVRSPSGISCDKCSVGTRTTEGQNVDFFFHSEDSIVVKPWTPNLLYTDKDGSGGDGRANGLKNMWTEPVYLKWVCLITVTGPL